MPSFHDLVKDNVKKNFTINIRNSLLSLLA